MGIYWDINKPLSYDCLFNFIVGARGVGKTYGCKKWCIDSYLRKKSKFVYVRRFERELLKMAKFFDDIKDLYPDHNFSYRKPNFYIDDEICGSVIALSTSKVEKSTAYPDVDKIIFDEFILDQGYHHYIKDEVTNFLELYSTIARSRDVKVMFLSNALTVANPYFMYFGITLPYNSDIKSKDDILIQMVKSDGFETMMKSTRFGKIVSNTKYGKYAIENSFYRDDRSLVEKKTKKSKNAFVMMYRGENIGVWIDYELSRCFLSYDIDPYCKIRYAVTLEDHSYNTMLLKGARTYYIDRFVRYYKYGAVRFESIKLKKIGMEIIKNTI